jgi:hypothetical protein
METISSGTVWITKKVLPVFWFGMLGLFLFVPLLTGNSLGNILLVLPLVILPLALAGIGFFVMKNLVWDLADEVKDGGDYLLVRRGSEEERVELADIVNVSASVLVNPPRITLRLSHAGRFGDEIAFSPKTPMRLNPFARNDVADDLIVRVDHARCKR